MLKVMQEKFQVVSTPSPDEQHGWTEARDARVKKMMPGREGVRGGDGASRFVNNAAFFNSLPPGTDIEDQEVVDIRQMGMSFNGNMPTGYATGDVTNGEVNRTSLVTGFDKKKMSPTDDMYSREHNDAFYDDCGGFVERNNMLDRL